MNKKQTFYSLFNIKFYILLDKISNKINKWLNKKLFDDK